MSQAADHDGVTLHASCVALGPSGLLITGASGSGKSSLALMLMAYGARLVADDATLVQCSKGALWASCPETIRGRIEARGIGILAADPQERARLVAAVDLDRTESERLPPERSITIAGHDIPLILNVPGLSFAAGLIQYLKGQSFKETRIS
ncbi:HPr kinase/phosphorylase [Frigidibacter sp. ROC022]|uniref:HPr kinase/phosphorylase n=1 Tax=Frigidibacter sp. ROC022 TaxID=2971796 RepID=UPI00215AC277|nr:HPr kinase/phosphatase C-terminal domain-containing protein [Frigidibacter sp. ROC022]MCR8726512.1 HPr kinase/phosphatase C-terminal domain-containing protein [Frigidibacter sp. ROC022]